MNRSRYLMTKPWEVWMVIVMFTGSAWSASFFTAWQLPTDQASITLRIIGVIGAACVFATLTAAFRPWEVGQDV